MKKIFSILVTSLFIFSFYTGNNKALAVAPTGTMTGTTLTVDIGQIVAMNAITIADAGAEITAGTDICVRINAATNAVWDVSDVTTAAYGGTGAAKASTTVSYINATTMKINITVDFLAGETLVISGLSFIGHTAAVGGAVLQWSVDNTNCTGTYGDGNANTAITVADGAEDTLTAVTTTRNSIEPTLAANHTVAFTVPATGVIPANGKILVTFPAGFDVTGATAGALTGIDGTVVLTILGQIITLTRQNDGTNATAGAKSVVINSIINPTAGGSYALTVTTDTSGDALLATANSTAFTAQAAGSASSSYYPSDNIPPLSEITNLSANAKITAGTPYTIKGKSRDFGGSLVTKLEISFDGGKVWETVSLKNTLENVFYWEYNWSNPAKGEYEIKVRATDTVGNVESPTEVKISVVESSLISTSATATTTSTEKPIGQMTKTELEQKIVQVQQTIIELIKQLIQILQLELLK